MSQKEEMEFLMEKNQVDFAQIGMMKIKQSFEAVFFLLIAFTLIVGFAVTEVVFEKRTSKNDQKQIIVNDYVKYRFNDKLKLSDISGVETFKKVKVKRGDSIYKIFRRNGIEYNTENIEKVKALNPKKQSIKRLKIGEELYFPILD